MVKLHSSEMFIKDKKDVWDNEHTIGNAELAARLGSPITFDRRGTVVMYDDFESAPLKWSDNSLATGTVTLSNEYPSRGSGCVKVIPPAVNTHYAHGRRFIGGLASGRMGTEFTLRLNTDVKALVGMSMRAYTGSRAVYSGISVQGPSDGGLKYLSGNDARDPADWTAFDTTFDVDTSVSYPLKFVVDFDKEEYVRCMFCGEEIDMSSYTPYGVANTSPKLIEWCIVSISIGAAETSYMDNCILTIDEPRN